MQYARAGRGIHTVFWKIMNTGGSLFVSRKPTAGSCQGMSIKDTNPLHECLHFMDFCKAANTEVAFIKNWWFWNLSVDHFWTFAKRHWATRWHTPAPGFFRQDWFQGEKVILTLECCPCIYIVSERGSWPEMSPIHFLHKYCLTRCSSSIVFLLVNFYVFPARQFTQYHLIYQITEIPNQDTKYLIFIKWLSLILNVAVV